MNLFFRELKAHKYALLFWSIGMIALVASGMAKYGVYQSSGGSANDIIGQFPKTIQAVLGISGFDLSKASGFYGVLFVYIALMATVHAVLLGTDIISKEERDRTSEFLFVKPISRKQVVTTKFFAGLTNLIILNIVTLFSSFYFVHYFNKGASFNKDIEILTAGLFVMQLLFFSIGTAIAAASKKPKSSPSTATAVLLITFILSFLINVNESLSILKYLTPFKYFDAKVILADQRLDPVYLSISAVIIMTMVIISYSTYQKRDLNV